ncbi:cytochrome b561 and DOMON domain-containing protein At4g17280-like [Nymphaea colorata]|nr:cytochrome b561 and DOMON domain-containing protein At4g17280-like [Nymphaea colorata]
MARSATYRSLLLLCVLGSLICASSAQSTCNSQNFANRVFRACVDLPVLNAFLHWTYFPSNGTIDIAYRATPSVAGGWVAWAINPTGKRMSGSQAIVGYIDSGKVNVITTNVNSYQPSMKNESLSFTVSNLAGESSGNDIILFATLTLPSNSSTLNQVWQNGPMSGGTLAMHSTTGPNIQSMRTLDVLSGQSTSTGGVDSKTRRKNVHGVLNAVSWGILMPIGIIIARYMRMFPSADPAWFYLHVTCQASAYILGVAGWGTGMKLGSESPGVQQTVHRNIGITLFCLGTLQVFALFLRPKKDHKYRIYWNFYHHSVGYTIIILSIINIFKGLKILSAENKWKHTYIGILIALAAIAVVLEIITWIVVLRRRSRNSEKSHHGANGTNGYGVRSAV